MSDDMMRRLRESQDRQEAYERRVNQERRDREREKQRERERKQDRADQERRHKESLAEAARAHRSATAQSTYKPRYDEDDDDVRYYEPRRGIISRFFGFIWFFIKVAAFIALCLVGFTIWDNYGQ
jgi:hypothetical protein